MPRGRPRKNPLPIIEESVTENLNKNTTDNPNETVIVNSTEASQEISPSFTKKKSSSIDPNTICMACGSIIPDTPNKIDLAMWLDAPSYKFNTKLNDKGRIILCHKCEKHLIETIDKELKKMGCKQKFELEDEY